MFHIETTMFHHFSMVKTRHFSPRTSPEFSPTLAASKSRSPSLPSVLQRPSFFPRPVFVEENARKNPGK
jgi:hypothetical protein